jgi:hypothetical protein
MPIVLKWPNVCNAPRVGNPTQIQQHRAKNVPLDNTTMKKNNWFVKVVRQVNGTMKLEKSKKQMLVKVVPRDGFQIAMMVHLCALNAKAEVMHSKKRLCVLIVKKAHTKTADIKTKMVRPIAKCAKTVSGPTSKDQRNVKFVKLERL